MKQISKKLAALFFALLIILGCVPIHSKASTEYKYLSACPFPRMGDTKYNPDGARIGRWGVNSSFVNKTFQNNMSCSILAQGLLDFTNLYSFEYSPSEYTYSHPVFCIEPGVMFHPTSYTGLVHDQTGWDRIAKCNDIMSGSELERIISLIVSNGYHTQIEQMLRWNNDAGHEKIAQMYATQLLIWEVAVNERDKYFNKKSVDAGHISVLQLIEQATDYYDNIGHHALYDKIMGYYREIEQKVKSGLTSPSFCTTTPDFDNPYEISYSNGEYRLEIVDTNNVLANYNAICNNEKITITKSGDKLIITTKKPFKDPIEIKFSSKQNLFDVILWTDGEYGKSSGSQDLIQPSTSSSLDDISYYITVVCPHVHVFIPHKEEPTCTEEGYTIWKCACGIFTTDDPHNGVDSHVAATGHDPNSPWVVSVPETCTENGIKIQICDRCNAILGSSPIPAHNHDKGVWQVDVEATPTSQGKMTRYCTLCGAALETKNFSYHTHSLGHTEVVRQASCTESGLSGKFCASCNACYATTATNKLGHTNANESIWTTTVEPTCLSAGEETGYCARCGEKTGTRSIDALGHTDGSWITNVYASCTEEGESICTCDRCGEVINQKTIPAAGHGNGNWVTTKKPTCKADGEELLICEKCGVTLQARKIDETGHDDGVWTIKRSATCTEKGERVLVCTACGKELESEKIEPTGHDEGVWSVTKAATCTEKGEKVLNCTICGKELESEKIEEKGHGEKSWITNVKATCTADGEEIYVCADCGGILDSRTLPKLGHDDGVTVISRPNGCTTPGEKITTCTRCGEVISSEIIPAEEHDEGVWKIDYAATVDHDGQRSLYCTKCEAVLKTETFPYHTHTYGYTKTTIEPSCGSKGEAGYFCKICDAQYKTIELDALEHDYSDFYTNNNGTHSRKCSICQYVDTCSCSFETATENATCTENGFTKRTCSVCGYTYQVSNEAALGHDWAKWVNDKNNETHTKTCNRCGKKETAVHIWTEWRLIEKNIEGWTATYQRKCDFCGAIQTSTVKMAKEPHAHELENFPSITPTCTEDGNSEYYHCKDKDCDKYFSDPEGQIEIEKDSWILPAHGHDYHLKENVLPTCTEDGYEYWECSYDASHNYIIEHKAHNHNYILKESVEPTCTENGYKYWECTYDVSHNYKEEIPAFGHDYVLKGHQDSTCLDEGYDYYECTHDASHNYQDVIPPHGHDYSLNSDKCKEATPDEPGYNYYECSYDPAHYYVKPVYCASNPSDSKSAQFDEETGVATITLDASADTETQRIPVNEAQPVDVVLVLDTSGSMAYDIKGNKSESRNFDKNSVRIDKLKEAAKEFISKISENEADNRIAVVSFSSDVFIYDDKANSIKAVEGITNRFTGEVSSQKYKTIDYSSSMLSAKKDLEALNSAVESLKSEGATRADCGMNIAQNIIANRTDPSRKVVIVFITDGVPTTLSEFNTTVANGAISAANILKSKYNAEIYSVGFAYNSKEESMTSFMNKVSSNYPDATSMESKKDTANENGINYYIEAKDAESLKIVFDTVYADSVVPSVPFSDITLFDTISKEFTMTAFQEQAFRNSVINEYEINNGDISVIRNDDGTTTITVRHLTPKEQKDESGKIIKYFVSISFDITANELAAGKSYYNTNTDNAGVIIEGMLVNKFSSPKVIVPDDRNIVVFILEGEVYSIAVANIGDAVPVPSVENTIWDMPEGFTVSGPYTEINGELTTEVRTLRWELTDDKIIEETYKVGQKINIFSDTEIEGKQFLGWETKVPVTMPDNDITIKAQYKDHTHTPKQISQYGLCTDGIVYVYACQCGYTYTARNEACPHDLKAEIANIDGLSFARVTCKNCSYTDEKYITYQAEYNEETIGTNFHGNTGTNQIFDIKMYDANDISTQPDGTIDIVIGATSQMIADDNLRIYRINENGEKENISFVKNSQDQTITMSVDHFSCYVITASNSYEAGKTYQEAICPFTKGHDYQLMTITPTCSSDGKTAYVCKNCGEAYGEETISASGHADEDHDGYCDGCGEMTEARKNCKHLCHSDKWYVKILWKFIRFFIKIFGIKQYCDCGVKHY